MIDNKVLNSGNAKAKEILLNGQLDRFVVFGLELQVCFLVAPTNREVWLSTTAPANFGIRELKNDFLSERSDFISQLYFKVGKSVSNIRIAENGELFVDLEGSTFSVCPDGDDFEEIWSITSDTASPYAEHEFSITLTDKNVLVVST
jgi:hypothetical protein